MNNIEIDYDVKRGRFILKGPQWTVGRMRAIPNRRWGSSTKTWSAPGIRVNVEHIKENFKDAILTKSAAKYISEYAPKKPVTANFPAWYKFKTDPYKHQIEALHKTYGLRAAALFMDMRTGKTKVEIDKHCAMRMEGMVDRVLLVCPLSIRKNWVREIATHAPFEIDTHLLDTSKPKLFEEWNTTRHDFKWLVVGVESLATGSAIDYARDFLTLSTKSSCLIDESSKIKNHGANRTKACISLGRMAEFRTIMTGTPIANGPLDLYAQFEFLDPDIIGVGDYYSFRNRYAVMGGYEDREVVGYQNMDELVEIISPFVFQARQKDVLDIPDKVRIIRTVVMSKEQQRLYKEMKKTKSVKTGDMQLVVQNTLEHMLRMQQITSGVVAYENQNRKSDKDPKFIYETIPGTNPKIAELISITEEYDGPTIVWCVYRAEIAAVVAALREKYGNDQVVEIHGDVSEEDRDINVNEKFQGLKSRFIVGNAATGGMGLTMNKAMNEVYMSNTYSMADRLQSEERATGLNKPKGVTVIDIIADKTVDEIVFTALQEKIDVSEFVRNNIDKVNAILYN